MIGAQRSWWRSAKTWRAIVFAYAPFSLAAHLAWEIAQLPLYTIWSTATSSYIAFSVVHCALGDLLIALGALGIALIATRSGELARWNLSAVGALAVVTGLGYTIVSERVNVALGNWGYSEGMPIVPILDVALSPLAQWLVVPPAAFWCLARLRPKDI